MQRMRIDTSRLRGLPGDITAWFTFGYLAVMVLLVVKSFNKDMTYLLIGALAAWCAACVMAYVWFMNTDIIMVVDDDDDEFENRAHVYRRAPGGNK